MIDINKNTGCLVHCETSIMRGVAATLQSIEDGAEVFDAGNSIDDLEYWTRRAMDSLFPDRIFYQRIALSLLSWLQVGMSRTEILGRMDGVLSAYLMKIDERGRP